MYTILKLKINSIRLALYIFFIHLQCDVIIIIVDKCIMRSKKKIITLFSFLFIFDKCFVVQRIQKPIFDAYICV